MKGKKYHPIFSDAPHQMGGMYLMQSLKHKIIRNASLKKIQSNPGFHKVESHQNLKQLPEYGTTKLPAIKTKGVNNPKLLLDRKSQEIRSNRDHKTVKNKSPFSKRQASKLTNELNGVLNCSRIDGDEQIEDESLTPDVVGKKNFIKNAKSYKIEELGESNDSFRESTLPVQKIKECLNIIGGVFTKQNLSECSLECNVIIDQPFKYIKKKNLREVCLLILALIRFDIIEEEVKFLNGINILYKGFRAVIAEDGNPLKYLDKLFSTLETVVSLQITAECQFYSVTIEFLNGLADQVTKMPEVVQPELLNRSIRLLKMIEMRQIDCAGSDTVSSNLFMKYSETVPWVFFEIVLEDDTTKQMILESENVWEALSSMYIEITDFVFKLQKEDFDNLKMSAIICDFLGIHITLICNPHVRSKLSVDSPVSSCNLERSIEYLLSTALILLQNGLLTEMLETKLERIFRLVQKGITTVNPNQPFELDILMQLCFKILCESDFEMNSNQRIAFSCEIAHTMLRLADCRRESFIKLFRHNRKNLDSIVFLFNSGSGNRGKRDYEKKKDAFLKPVIEMISLLK